MRKVYFSIKLLVYKITIMRNSIRNAGWHSIYSTDALTCAAEIVVETEKGDGLAGTAALETWPLRRRGQFDLIRFDSDRTRSSRPRLTCPPT
jgi:hypothetical protein